ncbi:flagellar biosynthesis protein FlhB [Desulfovibrio sp. OttesenSCG-928-G15]|nr:flagellar biosynthesis protein FlhB [Desulfovibrio sp. OttesenSCG-928-G15]
MANDPSKTEEPTERRKQKTREKGNVPKSQEVPKTVGILSGLIALTVWVGFIGDEIMGLMRYYFTEGFRATVDKADILHMRFEVSASIAKMVLPILLFVGFTAFAALRAQVGQLWTTQVFEPKWSKFNPLNGMKRLFVSIDTLIRLGKSIAMSICIGIAPMIVLMREIDRFPSLYYEDATGVAIYILTIASKMVMYAFIPMLIIAGLDLWYTRWKYIEDMKMSKDEVKDERKMMEGDMAVKNRMKQKMLALSAQRMMAQVPKADVVITNPTHIAVALKYDATQAPAPMVVAMGVDRVAEKIKEVAREHKVPIRQNVPLARALYKQVDVGDMIPAELFHAVAIVLAQIWKTKKPGQTIKR